MNKTPIETLFADNGVQWIDKEDGYCTDITIVKDHGKVADKYPNQRWASQFLDTTRVVELDAASYKRIEAVCKSKCIRHPIAKKGERFVMVQCKRDVIPGVRQFILLEHKTREGEYNLKHLMHNDNDYYPTSEEDNGEESPLDAEEEVKEEKKVKETVPAAADAAVNTLSPSSPQTDGKKSFAAIVASTSAVDEFPSLPVRSASPTATSPIVEKKGGRSKEQIFAELKALKQREVELLQELINA